MARTIWWTALCGNRSIYDALWSDDLTINTTRPDLTHCLQVTAINWGIYGTFILINTCYAIYLKRKKTVNNSKHSRLNKFKANLCLMQMASLLGGFIYDILADTGDKGPYLVPADFISYVTQIVAMMLAAIVILLEFRKGIISSGNMFLFWLYAMFAEITVLYSDVFRWNNEDPYLHVTTYIFNCLYLALTMLQFICSLKADLKALPERSKSHSLYSKLGNEKTPLLNGTDSKYKSTSGKDKAESKPAMNPTLRAPFWQRISFMWFTRIVVQGYKKVITFPQLPDIRPTETTQETLKNFDDCYYTGKENMPGKRSRKVKRGFIAALNLSVIGTFLLASLFRVMAIPVAFVNPQLLSLLIGVVEKEDSYTWQGLAIAGCMLVVGFTNSILINNFLFTSGVAGMRARSVVNAIVYRKALKLSSTARRQTTVGQIVNLMSVDAQKVQEFFLFTTLLWSVPVMIVLAMYFLWQVIGPSCLAGLAVLCVLVPLNAFFLAKKAMGFQRQQMRQKDDRFRIMGEILSGMKVLKLYAWEPSFQKQVIGYREKELTTIKYANYINAFGSMCWLIAPYLVSLAIFATYVLSSSEHVLDAQKTFVTLSLINLLNWPMSLLPQGVNNTVQGLVSMKRIAKFLELDELDDDTTEYGSAVDGTAINVVNSTFSWGRDELPTLKNIDMQVERGSLVAIVGQVGCGKSSLINALLGELYRTTGTTQINGQLAYVPQQAWIQNNTMKGNILFNEPYDEDKYNTICDACALTPDIAVLPGGDMIEIGEKGINLSGGQKQRVSLARAVYHNADIYLLDDPLSAVDAHVGKHIFEKVIGPKGLLRYKSRVLVTHGITYLPKVDYIYVIRDGRISEFGKYQELMERNGAFAEFLHNHIMDKEPELSEEAEEFERIERALSQSASMEALAATRSSLTLSRDDVITGRTLSRSMSTKSRRRSSIVRRKSTAKVEDQRAVVEQEKKKTRLIHEETSQSGLIDPRVLKAYIKAGGVGIMVLVCISEALFIVAQILTNLWLTQWSEDILTNDTTTNQDQAKFRVSVYGYLGIGQALFALGEAFAVAQGCYIASRVLHHRLLDRIMHAPMSFFDTTPLGRILNRFSKDLDVVDTNMPIFIRQWLFSLAPVCTTLILISYTSPIFVAVMVFVIILFVLLQRMYITTARQLKRIETVRRSPIYTHFDESISGAISIRAYHKEDEFIGKCDRLIDESQRPWYLALASYRWCGVCMESLGACIVFFSALFAVLQGDAVSASLAGLAVSYALQITVFLNSLVRNSSEMETYVTSIERIEEYSHIESEAPWEIPECKPSKEWPREGTVKFEMYSTRYRAGLELVLRNIHFDVADKEKIGVVGRTGAGKSSLSLSLFRIIESALGRIYIDGRDIGMMGLHDLRSKIAIIPQDPVIFSGTLRSNLDPFSQYTEDELWKSLKHAHMQTFVNSVAAGLDHEVGEGGESLSVGQRQLVCLARALLRHSKILILDEATAAVDLETDALIQTTIRTQFQDSTILTVAHRISTVLDYDRIMVLDKGTIVEFDSPGHLMQNKKSLFYSMAKDADLV